MKKYLTKEYLNFIKRTAGKALKVFSILVAIVLAVEFISFILVSASNFAAYGNIIEGGYPSYDPYSIFSSENRETKNNSFSDEGDNIVIWMFGGTTVWSDTPDDSKTLPSLLAKKLNAADTGYDFTVRNFGQISYNSVLEVQYYQKMRMSLSEAPDFVIFFDGANDSNCFSQFRDPDAHFGYDKLKSLVESSRNSFYGILKPFKAYMGASYFFELVRKVRTAMKPLGEEETANFAESLERRYDYMDSESQRLDFNFKVFWQPTAWTENEEKTSGEVRGKEKLFSSGRNSVFRKNMVACRNAAFEKLRDKTYFHDLSQILEGRNESCYKPDGVLLNDGGREIIADKMAAIIILEL